MVHRDPRSEYAEVSPGHGSHGHHHHHGNKQQAQVSINLIRFLGGVNFVKCDASVHVLHFDII